MQPSKRASKIVVAGLSLALLSSASCLAPATMNLGPDQAEAKIYAPTVANFKFVVYSADKSTKLIRDPRQNGYIDNSPELVKGMFLRSEGELGNFLYVRLNNGHVGWVNKSNLTDLEQVEEKLYLKEDSQLLSLMDESSEPVKSIERGSVFYVDAKSGDLVHGYGAGEEGWLKASQLQAEEIEKVEESPAPPVEQEVQESAPVQPEQKRRSVSEMLLSPPLLYLLVAGGVLVLLGLILAIVRAVRR